jgi:hypothetical protein
VSEHLFDGEPAPAENEAGPAENAAGAADAPLAAEALRLMSSVQDWARRNFPEAGPAPDGHTGAECQWCPLCQFVAVLRGERPELTERVAEAGVALASAFRALVDATAAAADPASAPEHPQRPRVQRIDLTDPHDED